MAKARKSSSNNYWAKKLDYSHFFLEVSRDQSRNQRLQRVIHLKPGYEMNVSTLFIFVYFIFSITKKFIIIIFLMKYIAIVAVVRYLHLISFSDGAYNNNLSAHNNQKYRLKWDLYWLNGWYWRMSEISSSN